MEPSAVLAASERISSLSSSEFSTVYNLFSLAIASLGFTSLFLVLSQRRVAPG